MILCWSVKGGSGVSVVAATVALLLAGATEEPPGPEAPVWLLDLAGDQPAVWGVPEPSGPGALDWIAAGSHADAPALRALGVPTGAGVEVVPSGTRHPLDRDALAAAAGRLVAFATDHRVVVDLGVGPPPVALGAAARRSLLVIRPCYLALRRAVPAAGAASGVVLVEEPGRGLGRADIEAALRVPVVATVALDPAVARAVDAGLLTTRLPTSLRRSLRGAL